MFDVFYRYVTVFKIRKKVIYSYVDNKKYKSMQIQNILLLILNKGYCLVSYPSLTIVEIEKRMLCWNLTLMCSSEIKPKMLTSHAYHYVYFGRQVFWLRRLVAVQAVLLVLVQPPVPQRLSDRHHRGPPLARQVTRSGLRSYPLIIPNI
jgi:hypothetical protein